MPRPHSSHSGREPRTRVVILGWYGSDNTGDEAVLEAIVTALGRRGVTDLHALSIDPAKTTSRTGVPASPRSFSSPDTLRALRGARALVLGGGGLIQDRTSLYNLPFSAIYVLLAKLFGLRVIGWGLGVEPLDTRLGRTLARFICASSAYFSVRDAGSKGLLVRAGVPPDQIAISADPAFLLEPEAAPLEEAEPGPRVLFCLRDLPDNRPGLNAHYLLPVSLRRRVWPRARAGNDRDEAFAEAVARAVRVCTLEFGANVSFLALWPGRDDRMIDAVVQAARRTGVPEASMHIERGSHRPGQVAALVGSADLLVSMRLHALLFGARQGVPALALAYARKMRGLMRMLGAERWVVEVEKRNPPPEEIEAKLRLLWQTRVDQSRLLCEAARHATQRAETDADRIAEIIQKTEIRNQKSESGRRTTDDGRRTADHRRRTTDDVRRTTDDGRRP
jgi:polysaccharide pyruvyl transferase WcaK-like protein